MKQTDYSQKLKSLKQQPLFQCLEDSEQSFLEQLARDHRLSFQEFRQVLEAHRDLSMWQEENLQSWWPRQVSGTQLEGNPLKKEILRQLQNRLTQLRSQPTVFPETIAPTPQPKKTQKVVVQKQDRTIVGDCPVASPKTVCCNLKTIDAVENCAFGCSYCTIQTFYESETVFDADFAEKLKKISIDPNRFYHFGTGQASDSLVWGDRNGNLTALCEFARAHPNVLLEFKTKSNNIRFFLDHDIPSNVVCSWSLNPQTIIDHEEHFTANLDQRLAAARTVADRGIQVAFHFHPMVYYEGWEKDYPALAHRLLKIFQPHEVSFISMGTLTFIKPVLQKIRELGNKSKILQMEMVPDPHGKLTYPDDIKIKLFKRMSEALEPWRKEVFQYFCMEKAAIWEAVWGWAYPTNEAFETDFGRKTLHRK